MEFKARVLNEIRKGNIHTCFVYEEFEKNSEFQRFGKDENVLCFFDSLLYRARVQEIILHNFKNIYLIHYFGYSKRHDEYVTQDRLLKFTEENVRFQKNLIQTVPENKKLFSKFSKQLTKYIKNSLMTSRTQYHRNLKHYTHLAKALELYAMNGAETENN